MPDNVEITAGVDTVIATDEAGAARAGDGGRRMARGVAVHAGRESWGREHGAEAAWVTWVVEQLEDGCPT